MASQRTVYLVPVGRAEGEYCAVPGRAAAKAAPGTPRISIRRPFGIGHQGAWSEWMGVHIRTGELRRNTITCWPTRRQKRGCRCRGLADRQRSARWCWLPLLQVRVAVGLALPVRGATPLADGLDALDPQAAAASGHAREYGQATC